MTDPIAWALDLLAAHNVPPLGEGEDPHRLFGELLSLGWDVTWTEQPVPRPEGQTKYQRCLSLIDHAPEANHAVMRENCLRLKGKHDEDRYVVTGVAKWLPVGTVRFVVEGRDLTEAVTFALAMALDLQKRGG